MSKTKTVREIPFSQIEGSFRLASYYFGAKWCPAVYRPDRGGYSIRITKSEWGSGVSYDYFELAEDGTVTTAPRGYAKDYKPGRITGLDEALSKYALPGDNERTWVLP